MNEKRKEKNLSKILGIIKKHRILKYPLLALMAAYLCVEYFIEFLAENPKKLCGVLLAISFFFMGSSFAHFPENTDILLNSQVPKDFVVTYADEIDSVYQNESYEIDDNDVLEEVGGMDFDSDIDLDRYSAKEILEENENKMEEENINDGVNNQEMKSFSADDWNLVLINKQHPVPEDYEFSLGILMGSVQCDVRVYDDLLMMLKAAEEDNISLMICSSYRDEKRQQLLFERKITKYMQSGLTFAEAYGKTSQTVTVPGASEHQIGLAMDIVTPQHTSLNEAFGLTDGGIWLRENSYKYGFILRYPQGKEDITGISYEPWHFRYVGKEAAQEMTEQELTLEEFVESIK